MAETSLHNELKNWYAQPGDQMEVPVEGYIIDLVRGDKLIEIQTRSFSSLRLKLDALLLSYPVQLVHPIAFEKWIIRKGTHKELQDKRRKSPKRGRVEQVFKELVYIPHLLTNPNFTLEILLTREEEIWVDDGTGSWRRKGWRIVERNLLEVADRKLLSSPTDYRSLLGEDLPSPFTTSDLAESINIKRRLAQQMAYCLRSAGFIHMTGIQSRNYLYEISST